MALTITDRGTRSHKASVSSWGFAPVTSFFSGTFAVAIFAYDNSVSGGADPVTDTGVTDSKGNTWTARQTALDDPGLASEGVVLRIFTSPMEVGALSTGDTITIAFSPATTAKTAQLYEINHAAGNTVAYVTGSISTGANTGTPSRATVSIAINDGVIGAGGAESANTWVGDADTLNGSWSTALSIGTTGGQAQTNISLTSQTKIVTAAGAQTYNPTLTTADCILAYIVLTEVSGGTFALTGVSATG